MRCQVVNPWAATYRRVDTQPVVRRNLAVYPLGCPPAVDQPEAPPLVVGTPGGASPTQQAR